LLCARGSPRPVLACSDRCREGPRATSAAPRARAAPAAAGGSTLLHPGGVVVGSEVHQEEARRARDGVHPLLEEDLAPRVEPMEVLDERYNAPGAPWVGALHEAAQHAEELALLRIGIHARHGTLGIRHAGEFE